MNIKLILCSGVVTALAGSVIGLAGAEIGQRDFNQLQFESEFYSNLHSQYAWIGAGVGFAIGVGEACLLELKSQE
jgi:hypothetical protein